MPNGPAWKAEIDKGGREAAWAEIRKPPQSLLRSPKEGRGVSTSVRTPSCHPAELPVAVPKGLASPKLQWQPLSQLPWGQV